MFFIIKDFASFLYFDHFIFYISRSLNVSRFMLSSKFNYDVINVTFLEKINFVLYLNFENIAKTTH